MKTMTVREVAEALGVAESTIRNKVRELFPEIVENGKATLLSETHVTFLKNAIVPRDLTLKSKLDNANTELEMLLLDMKVSKWKTQKIEELQESLIAERQERMKLEATNNRLMLSEKLYTATEIAKKLGMKSAQELNNVLHDSGIQYKRNGTWVPTSGYATREWYELGQQEKNGIVIYTSHFTQLGRSEILKRFKKEKSWYTSLTVKPKESTRRNAES